MSRRRPRLSWDAALDVYLTHLRASRASPRTIADRQADLGHLRDRLSPLRPDQVRLADLREHQLALMTGEGSRSGRPLSAGAVCRVVAGVRSLFDFLVAEGRLTEDPAARLERPKRPQRVPRDALTVGEVRRLLAAAPPTVLGLRDRTLAEVLYATGVRRAELIGLDLSDLDRAERRLHVRAGKGEKDRLLPLTRSAFHALVDHVDATRPRLVTGHADSATALFLTSRGRRIHAGSVLRALRGLRARSGIKKAVTPHVLRRTFASHLLRTGASLRHIQLLLGHASLQTTSAYLCLDDRELRRELLLRHPRERFE